ncbi:MAG: Tex family protein [Patescibacteria group bacterium]|nr:Tex family protein [Patescibacteria group bacterium]
MTIPFEKLIPILIEKTGISEPHIRNIIELLQEGSTIPFIARYRKEMTGSATDEQLRAFDEVYTYQQNLLTRKEEVLRLIEERGHLTDELRKQIEEAEKLSRVEDLYRPFKEKKNTRAATAIAKGLEPLADILQEATLSKLEFETKAEEFVKKDEDKKKSVASAQEAIAGAQDILAERYSDDPRERELLHKKGVKQGILKVKGTKTFEEKGVFKLYKEKDERVAWIPSHRYLAICRGEKEKQLSVKFDWDLEQIELNIKGFKIPRNAGTSSEYLFGAYQDGLKRLLLPSLERAIRAELKEQSDKQAISIFGQNLSQLLMTRPVVGRIVMGFDPAYRTGCKLAVLDASGKFLAKGVIYPTMGQRDIEKAEKEFVDMIQKYGVQVVAIGNGTATRESQEFVAACIEKYNLDIEYTVVSEAGASVYSASQLAQSEYPDLDVTIRGAISIAYRLQDPMAAFVKIDPKSLGVGQYQHDVDQKLLSDKLVDRVEDVVNHVGVDINTSSSVLLSYISGLSKKIADNIVSYREENGPFLSRAQIKKVKGLGPKAFEQAAGFLRIRNGKEELDNTGVHPESYSLAKKIKEIRSTEEDSEKRKELILALAEEMGVGRETVKDIIHELDKPGFDPRQDLPDISFRKEMVSIEDLTAGMKVAGTVRNITDFGVFIDIGLKNDGFIHISKISENRIGHPIEVVSVGQQLTDMTVIEVDVERGKVSLSLVSS